MFVKDELENLVKGIQYKKKSPAVQAEDDDYSADEMKQFLGKKITKKLENESQGSSKGSMLRRRKTSVLRNPNQQLT